MLCFISLFVILTMARSKKPKPVVIDCFVTHGINQYNGELLVNYTGVTTGFYVFEPVVYEIAALSPTGPNSDPITTATDPDTLLATTRDFSDKFSADFPADKANIPIGDVGSTIFGAVDARDRVKLVPFSQGSITTPYKSKNSWVNPTVGEWNDAAGRVTIECDDTGADVSFELCNALPNAVYTTWAVGCKDCLGENEGIVAVGAGGLPNFLITDDQGNGVRNWRQPWCPGSTWAPGGASELYFSAFMHFDDQGYGMSPAISYFSPSAPVGYVGSNHLWCNVLGERIAQPTTSVNSRSCSKNGRKKKSDDDDA